MKICVGCEEELPFKSFNKDSKKRDGLAAYCKACSREISQKSAEKSKFTGRIGVETNINYSILTQSWRK